MAVIRISPHLEGHVSINLSASVEHQLDGFVGSIELSTIDI